jgi:UDP-N-acetylmuramoylalanine--D-glutamate ligase
MITSRAWAGKHYGVLGLARSGLASAQALLASGARVTAYDERSAARDEALKLGARVDDLLEIDVGNMAAIVVSPGVPLNRHPIAAHAKAAGVPIIGDIELFAQARAELPPHKVVGITGTNGKSTTTALVHHILKTAGVPTTMGGNIGLPISAQEPLPAGGVYVLELSSYQIDLTFSLDCDVAVLLNVTPDHLDRYESFEAYKSSKFRLLEMQSAGQFATIGCEGEDINQLYPWLKKVKSRVVCQVDDDDLDELVWGCVLVIANDPTGIGALTGRHNAENATAAAFVAECLDLDATHVVHGFDTFPGLPHRMERVGERGGVAFINDSKATNAEAAAPALAAFRAVRWILGGRAKTAEIDACLPHLGHVRSAYTIGEAGPMLAELLRPKLLVTEAGTLDRAVAAAAADAQAGDTVLLSPACASFDQFRDFEDRGDQFRALVKGLKA